jgi:hypothetical protein
MDKDSRVNINSAGNVGEMIAGSIMLASGNIAGGGALLQKGIGDERRTKESERAASDALAKALASGDIYSDNGEIKTSGKTNEELMEEYGYTAEQLKEVYG